MFQGMGDNKILCRGTPAWVPTAVAWYGHPARDLTYPVLSWAATQTNVDVTVD